MAVNPLATDDLTIDFRELMEIPVSQRVQAAESSSAFVDAILQAMTPFQIAQAFPSYYQKELPDISNFITTNIERKLGASGRGYDQTGGGFGGTAQPSYGSEGQLPSTARPQGAAEPTIEDMKKSLLKRGIDVDKTYQAIGTGLAVDDPQVEFLKGMSPEKLSSLGIETYQNDSGQSLYRVKPVAATTMSDEDVLKAMAESSGKVVPGAIRTSGDNASYYDRMYNAVYKAAVEKGVANPEVIARLGATQTSLETGFGQHMVGNNAFGVKANEGGPSVRATTKEYINGRWVTIKDNFRQYASPEESAADYVAFLQENKRYKDVLAAKTIEEAIVAQGQTGYASDPGYESKLKSIHGVMSKGASSASVNKDMTEIIANSTPEEIQKFREDLVSTQKKAQFDNYVKGLYGQSSASSQGIVRPGKTTIIENGVPSLMEAGADPQAAKEFLKSKDVYNIGASGGLMKAAGYDPINGMNDEFAVRLANTIKEYNQYVADHPEENLQPAKLQSGWRLPIKGIPGQMRDRRQSIHSLGAAGDLNLGWGLNSHPTAEQVKQIDVLHNIARRQGLVPGNEIYGSQKRPYHEWWHFGLTGDKINPYYDQMFDAQGRPLDENFIKTRLPENMPAIQAGTVNYFGAEGETVVAEQTAPAAPSPPTTETSEPTAQPQQTSTVPEEPTPQAMALGGFIPEKDNLSVMNAQGDVVAKINEGELQQGLTREGSGMRVESNKKRMAESLVDQNERSMYASDIDEPEQETGQTDAGGFRQVQAPARITNDVMPKDQQWREAAAAASYPIGSQIRAFKRSKFMQEGYHFNRATPGSHT